VTKGKMNLLGLCVLIFMTSSIYGDLIDPKKKRLDCVIESM